MLRWHILLHSKSILATLGPVLGLMFIATISVNEEPYSLPEDWFAALFEAPLLIAGYFFSALGMPAFSSPNGRQSYLSLPASDTDKWIALWLYTGPIFAAVFTLSYAGLTLIVQWVLTYYQIAVPPLFRMFSPEVGKALLNYLFLVQPIGLIAAVLINRHAWAKLLGIVMLLLLAAAAIQLVLVRIVLFDYFDGMSMSGSQMRDINFHFGASTDPWQGIVAVVFVLWAFMVSFFRLQEKEV